MEPEEEVLVGLLDELETAAEGERVSLGEMVDATGTQSMAAPMLVFALVAVSPASLVPGVTSMVGLIEVLLVVQMLAGRDHLWLPQIIARRRLSAAKLKTATDWLRRPVALVESLLRPRLSFLTEKPLIYLWLVLCLALALVMPMLELVPGTGTVASGFIALVAAAMLTRDGLLVIFAGLCLGAMAWIATKLSAAVF